MVMTTGIGAPFSIFWVCALKALQNSMMFRPRWPSAGPIGGEGFAAPAGTCNFRYPVTFFAICHSCCADRNRLFQVPWFGSGAVGDRPLLPRPLLREARLRAFVRSDLLDLTEFQFD